MKGIKIIMNYLLEQYCKYCIENVAEYNFKKMGKVFLRVINDVMQMFVIEQLCSKRYCRVSFSVIPLCQGIEKFRSCKSVGSYELKRFQPVGDDYDDWHYDPLSKKSMDMCVEDIIKYIKCYLIPFFERTKSCKSTLSELIELEKLFDIKHVQQLKIQGIKSCPLSDSEFDLSDDIKYYIALKNGDFDFALRSRKALLQQNINSYNNMVVTGILSKQNITSRENDMEELRKDIDNIIMKRYDLINGLLEENEAYSRKNLKGII